MERLEAQGTPSSFPTTKEEKRDIFSFFAHPIWLGIVSGISIWTGLAVNMGFTYVGIFLCLAIWLSDKKTWASLKTGLLRYMDLGYDEIEENYRQLKSELEDPYMDFIHQSVTLYREIKKAIKDKDKEIYLTESFKEIFPAVQHLILKIFSIVKKIHGIHEDLRCHDMARTRAVLKHLEKKIQNARSDEFIKLEWIRTRNSLLKQLKSHQEIEKGIEYVTSKLTNFITSLREVHLSIIRLKFSDIHTGSLDLNGVFSTVIQLSEAIDDMAAALDKITYKNP
ncbi:MAG TPA: hypothetical protein VNM22_07530 [Candidatus Limnocylindrales bacterium]|nr:hypothetical protein [Candidatus Limnocylindrales bacterium]